MRLINRAGRLCVLTDDGCIDVEVASGGLFSSDPQRVFDHWDDFREWADAQRSLTPGEDKVPFDASLLRAPVPQPRQVFGIGLNYRDHAEEAGSELPTEPMVFTKFPSCIAGPFDPVELPPGSVDYESELVAVIGRLAFRVDPADAWSYVAGLMVGQDLSERQTQLRLPAPQQFNMAKSFPGFGPTGPYLVTPDELANPDDLEISCTLNGEEMQKSRTSQMVFSVPDLVSKLSQSVRLFPGDIIFTGTPGGIGFAREPKRLIGPGDELVTRIEGLGQLRTPFLAADTT